MEEEELVLLPDIFQFSFKNTHTHPSFTYEQVGSCICPPQQLLSIRLPERSQILNQCVFLTDMI